MTDLWPEYNGVESWQWQARREGFIIDNIAWWFILNGAWWYTYTIPFQCISSNMMLVQLHAITLMYMPLRLILKVQKAEKGERFQYIDKYSASWHRKTASHLPACNWSHHLTLAHRSLGGRRSACTRITDKQYQALSHLNI